MRKETICVFFAVFFLSIPLVSPTPALGSPQIPLLKGPKKDASLVEKLTWKQQGQKTFDVCKNLYDSGFYSAVIKKCEAFLIDYRESPYIEDALILLGDSYSQLHDETITSRPHEMAIKYYARTLKEFPSTKHKPYLLYQLAQCCEKTYNYQEAEKYYKSLMKEFPNSTFAPEAMLGMANIYYNLGKFAEAIATCDKILSRHLNINLSQRATFLKGETLFNLKDYKAAEHAFDKAVKNGTKHIDFHPRTLYTVAETWFLRNKYKKATQFFLRIVNVFPTFDKADEALLRVGDCYFEKRAYDKALWIYANIARLYPQSDGALTSYFRMADLKRLVPNIPVSEENEGTSSLDFTAYKDPPRTYTHIIETYPTSQMAEVALFKLGSLYYHEMNYKNALQIFKALLGRFPSTPYKNDVISFYKDCVFKAVKRMLWENKPEEVIKLYEEEEAFFPKNKDQGVTLYRIANCYEDEGNIDSALKMYEEIFKSYPNSAVEKQSILATMKLLHKTRKFDDLALIFKEKFSTIKNEEKAIDYAISLINMFYLNKDGRKCLVFISLLEKLRKQFSIPVEIEVQIEFYNATVLSWNENWKKAIAKYWKLIKPEVEKNSLAYLCQQQSFSILNNWYWDKKEYRMALKLYSQFGKKFSSDEMYPLILYRMAQCNENLQRKSKSKKLLQTLAKKYPESFFGKQAKTELEYDY